MTTHSRIAHLVNAGRAVRGGNANALTLPVLGRGRHARGGCPRWQGEFLPLWARGGEGGVSRITAYALFDPGGESGFWLSTGPPPEADRLRVELQ